LCGSGGKGLGPLETACTVAAGESKVGTSRLESRPDNRPRKALPKKQSERVGALANPDLHPFNQTREKEC